MKWKLLLRVKECWWPRRLRGGGVARGLRGGGVAGLGFRGWGWASSGLGFRVTTPTSQIVLCMEDSSPRKAQSFRQIVLLGAV